MKIIQNTFNINTNIDWNNVEIDTDTESIILPLLITDSAEFFNRLLPTSPETSSKLIDYDTCKFLLDVHYNSDDFCVSVFVTSHTVETSQEERDKYINRFCEDEEDVIDADELFGSENGEIIEDIYDIEFTATEKKSLMWSIIQILIDQNGCKIA